MLNYYPPLFRRSESLEATAFLRNVGSVKSILRLDVSRGYAGGYYYLHRNIKLYGRQDVDRLDSGSYWHYFTHIVQSSQAIVPPGYMTLSVIRNQIAILGRQAADNDNDHPLLSLPGGTNVINTNVDGKYIETKVER